jgi:hypothetical protein
VTEPKDPFEIYTNDHPEQTSENPYLDENGNPYHDHPNEEEELEENI